jgi:hypothetical protein
MATESISMAYFRNPSHQSVYPSIVAGQQLAKRVPAAINTHATMEELLEASFLIQSLSYQSGDSVVGIATLYGLDDLGFGVLVPVGQRIFSSPRRPDWLFNQPLIQWVLGPLSLGVKRQGREAVHSPPTIAEVKEIRIYIHSPIRIHSVVFN